MINDKKIWNFVFFFGLISTIGIFISLLSYVMINDNIIYPTYNVINDVGENLNVPVDYLDVVDRATSILDYIPKAIDYIWFAGYISLVVSLIKNSYFAKREGYFSIISLITFGIIFILFLSSIFFYINDYIINVLIYGVLSNVYTELTFFNFYLSNYGLLNTLVIFICIIANFVDFDFSKFNTRKDKEMQYQNDEII